jgi:hypothetical protein
MIHLPGKLDSAMPNFGSAFEGQIDQQRPSKSQRARV